MKRIHIVGCAPRSGTTLMMELMTQCFDIDGHPEHEMGIFRRPRQGYDVYCSKLPRDILNVRPLLAIDRNLWVIYVLRDPRDVVVSIHQRTPGTYYTSLRRWKEGHAAAKKLARHPRFFTVRYEDLVSDPQSIQQRLMSGMPFLVKRADFVDFYKVAQPSERALGAMGGLRPISKNSVGAWRQHKPRLAAQLELHGSVADGLIELGYEEDNEWLRELDGVAPEHHESALPKRSRWNHIKWQCTQYKSTLFYSARVLARELRVRATVPR